MALSIKDDEADALARRLAKATGESLTVAVREALRERLRRIEGRVASPHLRAELRAIRSRCSSLPVLDPRPAASILGYGPDGLPG